MAMQRAFTTSIRRAAGPVIDAVVLKPREIIDVAPPRQGWLGVMVCAGPARAAAWPRRPASTPGC